MIETLLMRGPAFFDAMPLFSTKTSSGAKTERFPTANVEPQAAS